jgi:hypothetical protein
MAPAVQVSEASERETLNEFNQMKNEMDRAHARQYKAINKASSEIGCEPVPRVSSL